MNIVVPQSMILLAENSNCYLQRLLVRSFCGERGVHAGNQNALEFYIKLESALSTALLTGTFTFRLLIASRLVELVALVAGSLPEEALKPPRGASPYLPILIITSPRRKSNQGLFVPHQGSGAAEERERGARIALAQGERFSLDSSSGRGYIGTRIALAQDERFRWDFSSGERDRGARVALAQGDFLTW
ncbi:hypothetical protein J6590_087752 [Homalodisca vitripennis]|nr:hypothetical protein J6590_087752 [Homalodisca vitripennis]